ncbi:MULTISPECIES: TetR/AcrR family transcriptional regulator [Paenibacillus]|uniref:TetR family transcriptional regulator n=1 Tax=Paenibacillus campinasensis TaxID=66347 RepID=A0A268EX76_9BACL|nr:MULTISPECIES: TetR/AcrR family transcriptional regulator [Paenibacillus]MUG68284.1 TetR family transcriptional regulator [Paenibacillus campinasensis]PAD77727.1 TetR family transcriptional regulator [Paenibacillus campinasensis]PAK48053.1 TetR family transcriptional regulator [Paenibacillus sp. 7541]
MNGPDNLIEEIFEQSDELTEKQKKIILAAIQSFAEKGYASTSTSEIAKSAGVAEGTIFRHYKTKKDLLYSIIEPMLKKFIAPFVIKDMEKVLNEKHASFEDFLRAMIENRISFLSKNMLLFKILIQEIPFQPELKALFKEHIGTKVITRFTQVVEHYQEKGELIDAPPLTIIRLTASAIFGYLIVRNLLLPELDWDDQAEIDQTVQMIMHGIAVPKQA